MNKETLLQLRKDRGLTREKLATELGCSASALVHWEGGSRAIPDWVEEKMLRSFPIELPLEEIHALLDLARENNESFDKILAQAIRAYLASKRTAPLKKPLAPVTAAASETTSTAPPTPPPTAPTVPLPPQHIVTKKLPRRKNGTED